MLYYPASKQPERMNILFKVLLATFVFAIASPFGHYHHKHHHHHKPHPAPLVMRGPVVASWYYDQGYSALGCGFVSSVGVATLIAPCGTQFHICNGSRCITATRDDSGPYVAGRTFDLGIVARNDLGCSGLCSVTYAIVR